MKIRRTIDGKEVEIELTSDELYEAFVEQQAAFDLEDVRFYFADYTDEDFQREYGITRAEAEELFESVAFHLRRNIDKYDMMFEYALPAAVEDVFVASED